MTRQDLAPSSRSSLVVQLLDLSSQCSALHEATAFEQACVWFHWLCKTLWMLSSYFLIKEDYEKISASLFSRYLADAIKQAKVKPKVFVSTSGVGKLLNIIIYHNVHNLYKTYFTYFSSSLSFTKRSSVLILSTYFIAPNTAIMSILSFSK